MADTKLSALTEVSLPELEDLLYFVEDPAGTPTQRKISVSRLLGLLEPTRADGRLTLTTAVPVTTADVTAATSIFYTPDGGNRVSLYDGTRWLGYVFTERTLALGTLTSGKNYDVFLYDNAGTLTLEFSAAWTSDTARADALALQDGILVKSGAATRRYLGTFRTTSTTTTEDSLLNRYVWNANHQVARLLIVADATSHTYSTATVRQWNANTANRVNFVVGLAREPIRVSLNSDVGSAPAAGIPVTGTALDSTTALVAGEETFIRSMEALSGATGTMRVKSGVSNLYLPGIGHHFIAVLENSALATATDNFDAFRLQGTIQA